MMIDSRRYDREESFVRSVVGKVERYGIVSGSGGTGNGGGGCDWTNVTDVDLAQATN